MLLVGWSWYLVMGVMIDGSLEYFFGDEVYGRLTGEFSRGKPFWFYFAVVPLAMTPWLHLWPPMLRRAWGNLSRAFNTAPEGPGLRKTIHMVRGLDDHALFSLLWLLLPLSVFCISQSKMYFYILPLLVPVSLWMGRIQAVRPIFHGFLRPVRFAIAAFWVAGLTTFTLLPDEFDSGRSYKRLGEEVRHQATTPKNTVPVYGYHVPHHSISFYAGMLIKEPLPSLENTLRHLAVESNLPSILFVANDRLVNSMPIRSIKRKVLAKQKDWELLRISLADNAQPLSSKNAGKSPVYVARR